MEPLTFNAEESGADLVKGGDKKLDPTSSAFWGQSLNHRTLRGHRDRFVYHQSARLSGFQASHFQYSDSISILAGEGVPPVCEASQHPECRIRVVEKRSLVAPCG